MHWAIFSAAERFFARNTRQPFEDTYRIGVSGALEKVDPTNASLTNTAYRIGVDGQIYSVDPETGKLSKTNYRMDLDGRIKYVDPTTGKLTDTDYTFDDLAGEIGFVTLAEGLKPPVLEVQGEIVSVQVDAEGLGLEKLFQRSEKSVQENPNENSRARWAVPFSESNAGSEICRGHPRV